MLNVSVVVDPPLLTTRAASDVRASTSGKPLCLKHRKGAGAHFLSQVVSLFPDLLALTYSY